MLLVYYKQNGEESKMRGITKQPGDPSLIQNSDHCSWRVSHKYQLMPCGSGGGDIGPKTSVCV